MPESDETAHVIDAAAPEPLQDLNWSAARGRAFAERMLDVWEDLLTDLPDVPVARPESEADVRAAVALPIPDEPLGDEALVAHLREIVARSTFIGSPRFLAYISGAGTVSGAAAELLAA